MALADRIAYCTNVHRVETPADVRSQLEIHAFPLAERLGKPFPVGLWLPRSAVAGPGAAEAAKLPEWLKRNGLACTTMNAFPFGNFHAKRVKEAVYRPNWTTVERSDYTNRVADLMAVMLPEKGEGSISTLPLAYKSHVGDASPAVFYPMLLETLRHLVYLKSSTGKTIRLAMEPEPGCCLETIADAVRFFRKIRAHASTVSGVHGAEDLDAIAEHLGVCVDVCHLAVMYEDPKQAIDSLVAEDIRIPKVQLSSALELKTPSDRASRKYLARFVEERYLHQVTARHPSGRLLFADDLTASQALSPTLEWFDCPTWRVHFHVPLHLDQMGPLATTSSAIPTAMEAIRKLPYTPDLEIETYTWTVMPGEGDESGVFDVVEGLHSELEHVYEIRRRLESS